MSSSGFAQSSSSATPLTTVRPTTGSSSTSPAEHEADADAEDKRVRNTLASAKFRAKKKAHLEDVQQTIARLEGRHTRLQREVQDLKKENGFLKEIVQLKYGLDVDERTKRG